ncbi:hypothetical protein BGZ75_005395 [Mortierella antarctica]|nr:hypothetical protein BGZ75_005395 [Mortierella antarctica]
MDPRYQQQQQQAQYQHQRQNSIGDRYPPMMDPSSNSALFQQPQYQPMFPVLPSMSHPPPPLQHHHDPSLAHHQPMQQAHMHLLQSFWMKQIHEIQNVPQDYKLHHLPLARIKKVMKTDDDVKMISADAPMIFDKGCDIFITELTLRAWIHAEENKRRTLQRSDIAAAIAKTDTFDFLIDIVPREEYRISLPKEHKSHYGIAALDRRQSHEVFQPIPGQSAAMGDRRPSGVTGFGEDGRMGPNLSLEGYPFPYTMLDSGGFALEQQEGAQPGGQMQNMNQQRQ